MADREEKERQVEAAVVQFYAVMMKLNEDRASYRENRQVQELLGYYGGYEYVIGSMSNNKGLLFREVSEEALDELVKISQELQVLYGLPIQRNIMLPKNGKDAEGRALLYFDNTQLQRVAGFNWIYDMPIFTKNENWCDIDSYQTNFKNTEGKSTSVWLWKGDYRMIFNDEGWCTGAEIGAYVHTLADDHILESGKFTLRRTDGKVFLKDRKVQDQYWINGFVQGKNDEAANLIMDVHLVFYHEEDARSYCNAFNMPIDDKVNNIYYPANKGRDGTEGRRAPKDLKFEPRYVKPVGREVSFSWQ